VLLSSAKSLDLDSFLPFCKCVTFQYRLDAQHVCGTALNAEETLISSAGGRHKTCALADIALAPLR
jgi:hypothetical protein